jgi:hypothetical protein
MAKVDSPILLRSRLRNAVKSKSPEADISRYIFYLKFSTIKVEKVNRKKKSKDGNTSLKLRGKAPSPPKARSPIEMALKLKSDGSPRERKLHTPIKNQIRFKNLDSPEPLRSGRFSLRKTPARLKYLEDQAQDSGEDVSIPEFTPLRTAGVSMNQLRGSNDISTPAVNVLENARMTRQRAKKAIQKK